MKGCSIQCYQAGEACLPVKMYLVRTISREVFVTPQRLHAELVIN